MKARARVLRLAKAVAKDFTDYDLLTYSSAIAFQVLYAVVPLAMLALAALGLAGQQSLYRDHVAPTLRRSLSSDAYGIASRTAEHAMNGGRIWWATAGLAVTLWGVGASLRSMMTPLNSIYGSRETRSWSRRLLVSIGGALVVSLCVYAALLAVLGGRLLTPPNAFAAVALFLGRWLLAIAFLLLANAVLIRVVPAKKRPVAWISLGSALATACWAGATVGFGAYISVVSYSSFYGALATVVLLLVYLHVSAIAFLLGVAVDAELRATVRARRTAGRA